MNRNDETDEKERAEEAPTEPDLPSHDLSSESLAEFSAHESTPSRSPATLASTLSSVRSPQDGAPFVGMVIDGRYELEALLAEGGMGVVYKARHRIIDKYVAIKVLRRELATNPEITRRFLTEAQAASAIGSDHIVNITDFGELPDGSTYIIMEYLEGLSLGQRLDEDKYLDESTVVALGLQLTDALEAAHRANIVHRDLKPDNVFLVAKGADIFLKVLDFGIAKVVSGENARTRAGRVVGTPYYMSPEQSGGKPLDHRTDIYSTGVMFYEALAGRLPFVGDNPLAVLSQHIYSEPPRLRAFAGERVSDGMEAIVHKCLMKAPGERYADMAALKDDLLLVQDGKPPRALAELSHRWPSHAPSQRRPRRLLWAVVGMAAIVGLGLGAYVALEAPEMPIKAWQQLTRKYTAVSIVLAPIDAHLFLGERDLGSMPLTVRVPEGRQMNLSVRREGYRSKDVVIDGLQTRLEVSLVPLPGAAPPPQQPTSAVEAPMRTITLDEGAPPPMPAPAPTDDKSQERTAGPTVPGPPPVSEDLPPAADAGLPRRIDMPPPPFPNDGVDAASPRKPRVARPLPPPGPPPMALDGGR